MFSTYGGERTTIKCTEPIIPEFPNLLFGTLTDGTSFFDATLYLHRQGSDKLIRDFFISYKAPIDALCKSYDISAHTVYIIDANGHYLIDGNFVYLFIAFVEPYFLGYMCDRMHELFAKGVSVSDTYLLQAARERLSKEILEEAIKTNEQIG